MIDYIVVGSGLAGAVISEQIATKLDKKILLIEKRNHIGGNCYDFKDENNILVHKYGPHLFHTNDKEVVDYLSNFTSWDIYNHEVLAYIDGKKVPIPFNFNTLYKVFPQKKAKILEKKLLENFEYNSKISILELKKSKDKDLLFLANFIYEKIFANYTSKQWGGIKLEDMSSVVSSRVPVFIGCDNRYFNDKYQMLPKNGYTKMIENMLEHKNIKLMLNTDFNEICSIKNRDFYLFDTKFDGKVIVTSQIDELFEYKLGELPYRSVNMIFENINKEFYQEKATINYPNDYDFTRVTEFKHMYKTNLDKTSKTTILKEYAKEYKKGVNAPYYPVFTDENQKKYNRYLEYSKEFKNLLLLGRLAEYKYYDMDDIVKRALEVFQKNILNNTKKEPN